MMWTNWLAQVQPCGTRRTWRCRTKSTGNCLVCVHATRSTATCDGPHLAWVVLIYRLNISFVSCNTFGENKRRQSKCVSVCVRARVVVASRPLVRTNGPPLLSALFALAPAAPLVRTTLSVLTPFQIVYVIYMGNHRIIKGMCGHLPFILRYLHGKPPYNKRNVWSSAVATLRGACIPFIIRWLPRCVEHAPAR